VWGGGSEQRSSLYNCSSSSSNRAHICDWRRCYKPSTQGRYLIFVSINNKTFILLLTHCILFELSTVLGLLVLLHCAHTTLVTSAGVPRSIDER
jgi:hypothetical protein